jgi:hypothetical protein
VRLHRRLEIGILGLEVGEHIGVVDLGIGLVLQPEPGVLDGEAVALIFVRALFGLRGRRQVFGFRHGSCLG